MKNIFSITSNPNETIQDVRKQLLFWILIIINILGIPLVIIGFIEALLLNQFITACSYLICYSPILLAAILRNKISYKTCAGMILFCIYLAGVYNLIIYGFSGAAIPIFFTLLVFTTVFFDIKAGLKAVSLCLLPMVIIGFLFIQNKISLDVSLYEVNTYPISWFTASAVLVFFGILIIMSYGLVQKKMLHSIQYSKKQAEELRELNVQLKEDISIRKETENKLRNLHDKFESLIKERTSELEEKTGKLEKSQKSLTLLLEDVNESRVELDIANKKLNAAYKELEAFSYSVSHDLRAPLRHIGGFTKILNENIKHEIDEISQNYFDKIINSSKQMNQLIDDLLIFSRTSRKDVIKNNFNMKTVVDGTLQSFDSDIKEKNIHIIVDDMPDVNIDASLIRQVWTNLISNAIKFTNTSENPEIHIGVDIGTDGSPLFFIKDNGVGFDQKYVGKIFDVFQRLHSIDEFPGTGIGLANVKRIIMKHDGKIRAEGKINEGASFFFTLPNA